MSSSICFIQQEQGNSQQPEGAKRDRWASRDCNNWGKHMTHIYHIHPTPSSSITHITSIIVPFALYRFPLDASKDVLGKGWAYVSCLPWFVSRREEEFRLDTPVKTSLSLKLLCFLSEYRSGLLLITHLSTGKLLIHTSAVFKEIQCKALHLEEY